MLSRTAKPVLLKLRSKWKRVSWLRTLGWVDIPFSRGSSQPRDWTQVLQIRVDSLPAEPPGKKKKIWSQRWERRKTLSQDALPEQSRRLKNNPHQILKVPMELKALSLTDPFLSIHTAKKKIYPHPSRRLAAYWNIEPKKLNPGTTGIASNWQRYLNTWFTKGLCSNPWD